MKKFGLGGQIEDEENIEKRKQKFGNSSTAMIN